MCDLCKMLLNICREKVAERDAAQARVRELEAENETLRQGLGHARDEANRNANDAAASAEQAIRANMAAADLRRTRDALKPDAALGADLRCLMEWMDGGNGHVEVWGSDWVRVYKDLSDDDGTGYDDLAEASAAVRKWQAGQGFAICASCRDRATCTVAREATRPADGHAERPCPHYRPAVPAPSPEDAATARIEAAGGRVERKRIWRKQRPAVEQTLRELGDAARKHHTASQTGE